ncbi:MAG TPA: peptidoglycan DD-metalloendopeptidase family protein [Acidimicrobiia bacterium]|nr:peptidoglycan DD-metalloendopeptidase family protein [Acidimicrobiia bacterium]
MKKLAPLISGVLALSLAVPALAQVTEDDIRRARHEVNRITDESAELGQAVIDAYGRQAALDAEITALQSSIEFAQIEITETEARLEELAVELYMGSTSGVSLSVLFSATDQSYPAGMEYLREASGVDETVVSQLRVFRDELDRQTSRLSEALEEQQIVASELETLAVELQEDLVTAQEVYDDLVAQQQREEEERRLREEEERRRQAEAEAAAAAAAATSTTQAPTPSTSGDSSASADPTTTSTTAPPAPTTTAAPASPPPSGAGVCPVAGAVSFTDSWGAPRSGGRTHKGVDMMAARGVPIVAIYSGSVYRLSNSALGGKSVYFYSDAGDMYYYAHLDDFGAISPGQSVPAGYVLGYNGSSGNAPDYLPHLHFEYHPGGSGAVNPYPLVRSLC